MRASSTARRRAFAAVGVAAMLSGCMTVGPNFQRPAPPTVTGYAQVGDDANAGPVLPAVGEKILTDWWTLFHSPELNAIVQEAIANSPSLEEARARLAEAREQVSSDTGQLMVDGNADYKRQRANLKAFSGGTFSSIKLPAGVNLPTNPEFNLYSIGGTVSYNPDLFGQIRRKKEAAEADADEKARELDAAYLTLTGEVVTQVISIASAKSQIQYTNAIVESEQADLDMIRKAHAAGGATAADIKTYEVLVAQDSANIPNIRQRLMKGRHMLALLVGKSPSEWTPPDFNIRDKGMAQVLPVSIPSELVRNRPDILEAEARLHAATARVGVATGDLYPSISLTGSLSQDALTPESLFTAGSTSYAFGPALTLPLFHSGELHAKKRAAEEEARAALAVYKETVLAAFAQVADALQAVAHSNDALTQQLRALDAATGHLEMMRNGYRAGGVSALQLEDAELAWRRTRMDLALQGVNGYADAARLLEATAAAPPGLEAGPPPPKPYRAR
jgi:NodT family efflux transporter outer membrane factor (OMF) lipoprotein